jgi:hypothetical protein
VSPEELLGNGTRIRIGSCWVVTTLPNGAIVNAHPCEESAASAEELGYPQTAEGIAAMTRTHDPLHARLTNWLGMPHSFSLMKAAGCPVSAQLADLEERAVIAVQRFQRAWEAEQ